MGKDSRFDDFRNSKSGFLKFWILQSVSIWIIALPVMTGLLVQTLTLTIPAVLLWLCGWLLESASDWQKFTFKSSNNNSDFINTGLYSSIRHPNYLGEILVWLGIFWYVAPSLSGWMWWSIISPAWVIILLVKVSGIPIIEKVINLNTKIIRPIKVTCKRPGDLSLIFINDVESSENLCLPEYFDAVPPFSVWKCRM